MLLLLLRLLLLMVSKLLLGETLKLRLQRWQCLPSARALPGQWAGGAGCWLQRWAGLTYGRLAELWVGSITPNCGTGR